MKKLILLLSSMLILSSAYPQTPGLVKDGPGLRSTLSTETSGLFNSGDYKKLEELASQLRGNQERWPDGFWKLESFYKGLRSSYTVKNKKSDDDWLDIKMKLDDWISAYPNSITPRVVLGYFMVDFAWHARGGGWANTVTEEGWNKFRDRLAEGKTALNEARTDIKTDCPGWHDAMLVIALGQGWDRKEYDKFFDNAVSIYPTYYSLYFKKAYHLQRKWYGRTDNEWVAIAENAVEKTSKDEGDTMYARICWNEITMKGYDSVFEDDSFSWEKMRKGFLDIEKKYPRSSWNLNNFCLFACVAKDRDTARELFKRIGDDPNIKTWTSKDTFNNWKKWAEKPTPPAAPAPATPAQDDAVK
ncbi:MAG: hypothetical protein A2X45_22340 [Lentisphaerae bacterium GWF2_50_93]|nr:MAG: hypothetical protein A2X45_22340 [Lentisphaerae bacterium GWF2_50_93]